MTRTICRRHFVKILAGASFVDLTAGLATTRNSSLTRNQIEAAEVILRRLVDQGAVPGISYSIGNKNDTLAEGACGLRSINPRAAMEVATRCPLASVSKQFVSAGAYLLHQKGVLSLDAPLSEYVSEYVHGKEMTLSQLLTMRSGVPADDEKCEAPVDNELNAESLIANLNKQKLDFSPARYFAYSNCAYDLAGIVLSRVAKMSYAQFVDKNFFQPLGMKSSYVLGSREEANFAKGYGQGPHGWKPELATAADRAFASGNLVSTPSDMQLWNRSLLNATVLSRESLQKMFAVPTADGPAHTHYVSGWFVEPSGIIWHAGTLAGYGTNNMLVPATGYAITLLSNTPQNDRWKPADVAVEMYNAAALGPKLPPLLKRVRTTVPQ